MQNPENTNPIPPYPVEDCATITAAMLGKGILQFWQGKNPAAAAGRVKMIASAADIYFTEFQPVPGNRPKVEVKLIYRDFVQRQEVYLAGKQITFGVRPYLLCTCGRAVVKLYHRPRYYGFGCRKCENLKYKLQNINKRSGWGRISYWTNRMKRLEEVKAGFRGKPLTYRGRATKRFRAFIHNKFKWTVGRSVFDSAIHTLQTRNR